MKINYFAVRNSMRPGNLDHDILNALEYRSQAHESHPLLRKVLVVARAVAALVLGFSDPAMMDFALIEILQAFEGGPAPGETPVPPDPISVDRLEWEHIQKVLQDNDNNISATARALGMHRRTLQRKLQKRPVRK